MKDELKRLIKAVQEGKKIKAEREKKEKERKRQEEIKEKELFDIQVQNKKRMLLKNDSIYSQVKHAVSEGKDYFEIDGDRSWAVAINLIPGFKAKYKEEDIQVTDEEKAIRIYTVVTWDEKTF